MGGSVNQGAQDAEQANQVKAQQYAAQQQQQALAAVNGWIGQNKPPGQSAAPLTPPTASSPATIGGGVVKNGVAPPQHPPQAAPPQAPPAGAPAPAPAGAQRQLQPQQLAALVAQMQAQRGAAPGQPRPM